MQQGLLHRGCIDLSASLTVFHCLLEAGLLTWNIRSILAVQKQRRLGGINRGCFAS